MKLSRKLFISMLLLLSVLLFGCNDNDDTGEVSEPIIFGDEGWDTIRFHNEVAGIIIEEGYGYETEQLSGSDAALWKGFEDGDIDVHMEAWTENIKVMYEKALDSGNVVELTTNFDDNLQAIYVPTYVIEGDEERGIEPMAPDLEYIEDLADYSDVFVDPEDSSKGRIVGPIPEWTDLSDAVEETVKENNLDDLYNLTSPGSEAALNVSLIDAYESGEPWLGYNYEPNWIMESYDMTPLLEKNEDGPMTEIASQDLNIAAHVDLIEAAPEIKEFLENYNTTSEISSEALVYIQDDHTEHEAAINFLKKHEDLWTEWVPEDIAEKVKDAI